MTRKITEETTLGEVLQHPECVPILVKHRLPCISCPMAQAEMGFLKLGDIARAYGIDAESLIKELNEAIEEKGEK
ncbi:disulfide oxidoreductase [Candidatus Bathyarchaeota archaeon]|nr:MAG: disulfide oxidoreductase [Candidatus Bathyarchaeota archaeon]